MPTKKPKAIPAKDKEKKVAIGDAAGMKHALDSAVVESVCEHGYSEDHTDSNVRLLVGFSAIGLALLAQFYPGSLTENWNLILGCVIGYTVLSAVLTLYIQFKQKDSFLITKAGVRRNGTDSYIFKEDP